jgi:hypothetical protein
MRRLTSAAVLLVLAALAARDAAGDSSRNEWPFGTAPGDDRAAMRKRDLYNLGILGAKARDASRTELTFEGGGRREVKSSGNDPSADLGPDRLQVEILYPDGPAAKAGLRVGDVLTGVSGKRFKDGSLAMLAKALVDAESGRTKGVVKLTLDRAGEKDVVTLDVAVPVAGKDAEKPTAGKTRDALIAAAADWLAKRQESDGGYAETLSGTNGAVVQTCMAGLVWLAAGSDREKGPYADNLRRAADFVAQRVGGAEPGEVESLNAPGGGANWSQVNWGLAHGAIFLGEMQARSPDDGVADALRNCAEALAKNQEASGGWAHGPGGPNALGYVELNIVTGLALSGLGLAQRAGFPAPPQVLKKADLYLEASSSGDGGVGYSAQPGQVGQGNIGRTAAAWLGAVTLGQRNAPFAKKMEAWVRSHAGEVFGGHASLMQHYLLAGVAAHAQGGETLTRYWAACERDLVLARAPDGSFQPRPFHESLAMGSNSDVAFGEVWTTAAWAVVLGCEPVKGGRPGLPAWTGKLPPPLPPKKR